MKEVKIYTDGACSGNPGVGGFGTILDYKGVEKEISCGFSLTTNNRMELMAAICGLESLTEACKVTLCSDSQYVVNAINQKWLFGWVRANFVDAKTKKERVNADLWRKLYQQIQRHDVTFVWVKGHDGHPQNERCDRLAVSAMGQRPLKTDEFYKN